jgi:hypothetical protein
MLLAQCRSYYHTQIADRLYPSAEQRGILDFVSKLFQVPSSWFCRQGVLLILFRVQTPATRTEVAFFGMASLALCGLDLRNASWPSNSKVFVGSRPGLDHIQMFSGSSMTYVFQS